MEADNLNLNFEEIPIEKSDSGCQLVLQNEFFKEYFVYITKDMSVDSSGLWLSFKEIKGSDFKAVGTFIFVLVVLIILAIVLIAGFFIYSKYRNKKEADTNTQEEYASIDN